MEGNDKRPWCAPGVEDAGPRCFGGGDDGAGGAVAGRARDRELDIGTTIRLTFLALGSRGDVQPYVALGSALAGCGYRVRIATFESFREMVARRGLDFHPVPGDAQAVFQVTAQALPAGTRNPFRMMRAIMRGYGALVDDYIRAFSSEDLFDSDAILNQLPGGLFGGDLAERLGIPYLTLSVIPLVPTRAFPLPLLASRSLGGPLNLLSYAFAERMLWVIFRPRIREFRRILGLGDPPRRFPRPGGPIVNGFSTHVVPPPPDWPGDVHVTGYWTLPEPDWEPPGALVRFIEAGDPPVFLGFGSMIPPDPGGLMETLLEAVQMAEVRAVIGRGWAGFGKSSLPDNVFAVDYAPYDWLFPRMAAVVHHGGSGTTGLALQGGVPSMVVSFAADQDYWGERTRALGCGPAPISIRRLTAGRLAEALERLVTEPALRERAQALGGRLREEDGLGSGVRVVRGYLDTIG
ncbi:MAG TPA: glycosyltransferase [Anaerolineales bacterium]|nr:glycosyltransferase [Anaerolineales bacterium]